MAAWLQWNMRCQSSGFMRVGIMFAAYDCPNRLPLAHVFNIIHIGEYYYLIEPQSGRILGPLHEETNPTGPMRLPGGTNRTGWVVPDCPIIDWHEYPVPSDQRDRPGDAPPWWKDRELDVNDPRRGNLQADMWERFQYFLNLACDAPCIELVGLQLPAGLDDCGNVYGPHPCNAIDRYLPPYPNWRDVDLNPAPREGY